MAVRNASAILPPPMTPSFETKSLPEDTSRRVQFRPRQCGREIDRANIWNHTFKWNLEKLSCVLEMSVCVHTYFYTIKRTSKTCYFFSRTEEKSSNTEERQKNCVHTHTHTKVCGTQNGHTHAHSSCICVCVCCCICDERCVTATLNWWSRPHINS